MSAACPANFGPFGSIAPRSTGWSQACATNPAVSAKKLAAQLNANPSDVSRRFHGDLGVRLVDYRARLRLMRFVRCVDSGQDLIDAALNADFGSYAQCHRVFQRFLRCAPQRYFAGARRELDELLEQGSWPRTAGHSDILPK